MKGVTAITDSHNNQAEMESIRRDLARHEELLSKLTVMSVDIATIAAKVQQVGRYLPGEAPACIRQQQAIDEIKREVVEVSGRIKQWVGGLAVLMVLVSVFGPKVASMIIP
jgi:hypothetical protein